MSYWPVLHFSASPMPACVTDLWLRLTSTMTGQPSWVNPPYTTPGAGFPAVSMLRAPAGAWTSSDPSSVSAPTVTTHVVVRRIGRTATTSFGGLVAASSCGRARPPNSHPRVVTRHLHGVVDLQYGTSADQSGGPLP